MQSHGKNAKLCILAILVEQNSLLHDKKDKIVISAGRERLGKFSKERWMFSAASVCLFVCSFVCVFINTITAERVNIG